VDGAYLAAGTIAGEGPFQGGEGTWKETSVREDLAEFKIVYQLVFQSLESAGNLTQLPQLPIPSPP
jgi:hypothetical protein